MSFAPGDLVSVKLTQLKKEMQLMCTKSSTTKSLLSKPSHSYILTSNKENHSRNHLPSSSHSMIQSKSAKNIHFPPNPGNPPLFLTIPRNSFVTENSLKTYLFKTLTLAPTNVLQNKISSNLIKIFV